MKATATINIHEKLGQVHPYIYGQYFEHLGNCIYPSVSDKNSPLSDDMELRVDVIEAAKELGVPVIRWPGGCYVDLYDWRDGVGPRDQRPARHNWHWEGVESNRYGTDEFLHWCEAVGADPYINVNLGTGTLVDMLRWIDYCNGEETADAKWRQENGREKPYDVKLWGIGNETWGFWEAGQLSAEEYAHKLANWSQFVKKYDPAIRLLGVGSYKGVDQHWDSTVIDKAGKFLDYLTIHIYGCSMDRQSNEEYYPIVFSTVYFERQLRKMAQTIKETVRRNKLQLDKPIQLSLDEWNIRHYERNDEGKYTLNRNSPRNLQDALFVAGIFNVMIRLSPLVGMANYVFLVNGNGVMNVTDDQVVRTPLYHVFKQYGAWMVGERVHIDVHSPMMLTPAPQIGSPEYTVEVAASYEPEPAPIIDSAAVLRENGELCISLVNRDLTDDHEVTLILPSGYKQAEVWTLVHEDIHATNTPQFPNTVVPVIGQAVSNSNIVELPAHSITLVRCIAQ